MALLCVNLTINLKPRKNFMYMSALYLQSEGI